MATELSVHTIEQYIFHIRGNNVILDTHLAGFFDMPVKRLNEQVKRHNLRFPDEFRFRLQAEEYASTKEQSGASVGHGKHRKHFPHAYTDQGVAMLSVIFNTELAIRISVTVMRAFTLRRRGDSRDHLLTQKLDLLEQKVDQNKREIDAKLDTVLSGMNRLAYAFSSYVFQNGPLLTGTRATSITKDQPRSREHAPDEATLIQTTVASHYNLKPRDLNSSTHASKISLPRQIAMYLIRKHLGTSFKEIGAHFGRDHTTVLHACEKIQSSLAKNKKLRDAVEALEAAIREKGIGTIENDPSSAPDSAAPHLDS